MTKSILTAFVEGFESKLSLVSTLHDEVADIIRRANAYVVLKLQPCDETQRCNRRGCSSAPDSQTEGPHLKNERIGTKRHLFRNRNFSTCSGAKLLHTVLPLQGMTVVLKNIPEP